jgi:GT2 family glycosyltransferase
MDLSIIIVNWNSREYLRNCIASILATTHGIEFEIVVIDSASFDGCDEMLQHCYPQVRFIQSDRNLGFAKANNEAFQVSQGDVVLFLNPDTELDGPAIVTMYRYMQTLPDPGAIGCKLLNSDSTLQTSCVQAFPTIANQVLDAEALRQRFPHSRLWGTAPLFERSEAPAEVDAISGACLMIRRSVFEKVGLFSTDYFMYSEDVDLCYKIRNSGWKNYYLPTAVVVHHGGGSTAKTKVSAFSNVMLLESRWRFFIKNRSVGYGRLYQTSIMAVSLLRIFMAMLLRRVRTMSTQATTWEAAFQKWNARLRWTLGLENWVKNL